MVDSSGLIITLEDGVRLIKFNRPEKKNAFHKPMYEKFIEVLSSDATNDKVVLTIITGNGDAFSSGNDFKALMGENPDDQAAAVRKMIETFIDYPKILVAVVNGPAYGIGATILGLCDIVYATDKAVFGVPFVKIALCAEGASSFTFPFILGRSKASEMIFFGEPITAQEAYNFGLISRIIPNEKVEEFIQGLRKYGKLSVKSITLNKRLIMRTLKDSLWDAHKREFEQLMECFNSEEFMNSLLTFLNKKSKL